jgi:hypothetical protein
MTKSFDLVIQAGLGFLILATPFAFGSVLYWAFLTLIVGVFVLGIVSILGTLFTFTTQPKAIGFSAPHWAGILLVLYIAFQLVPMPPSLLKVLSPKTHLLYELTLAGWPKKPAYSEISAHEEPSPQEATWDWNGRLFPDGWRPIALNRYQGWEALLKAGGYLMVFFLVTLHPWSRPRRHGSLAVPSAVWFLCDAILVTAFLVSIVAIFQKVFWNGKILWVFAPYDWYGDIPSTQERLSGPFVNPNHLSSYLGMGLPMGLWRVFSLSQDRVLGNQPVRQDFKSFLLGLTAVVRGRNLLLIFSLIVMLGVVIGTGSRGGWAGLMVGGTVLSLFLLIGDRSRRSNRSRVVAARIAVVVVSVIVAALVLIGGESRRVADERLASIVRANPTDRIHGWPNVWEMIKEFPVFGVGIGSWEDLYPAYKNPPDMTIWDHAHNDYLEWISEVGIVGGLISLWLVVSLFVNRFRKAEFHRDNRSQDAHRRRLGAVSLLTSVIVLMVHEVVDFNLHIPAIAFLFSILAGMFYLLTERQEERLA